MYLRCAFQISSAKAAVHTASDAALQPPKTCDSAAAPRKWLPWTLSGKACRTLKGSSADLQPSLHALDIHPKGETERAIYIYRQREREGEREIAAKERLATG